MCNRPALHKGTTVKFQATSCFHRVLWQITIFVLVKLSKNRESCCQGYVLCKDIFVTSRSTRGPLSLEPYIPGPSVQPKASPRLYTSA